MFGLSDEIFFVQSVKTGPSSGVPKLKFVIFWGRYEPQIDLKFWGFDRPYESQCVLFFGYNRLENKFLKN